jgi:orotate phosphoribosyltransferase
MTLLSNPVSPSASCNAHAFLKFALDLEVLRFGEFTTKAGRLSPYFFNAGLFNTGSALNQLCQFYAHALLSQSKAKNIEFDMLFGPAYKGIPLAAGTAMQLAGLGHDIPFAFNRKEAKAHGEGGTIVGAPLKGRVVIIDDVITAGTSVRESVDIIRAAGATPAAVLIALDRMEKGVRDGQLTTHSAVQEVQNLYGIPVFAIASLSDLMGFLDTDTASASGIQSYREQVKAYRVQYGV